MRRPLKIAAWTLAGLLLGIAVLLGGLVLFGNTDRGRAAIENLTARLSGGNVRLRGLAGSFPAHLTLEELELSDDRGVWLTARHIEIRWSPLKYFSAGLSIEEASVAQLSMERLPHFPPPAQPRREVKIPNIEVAHARIDSAHLGRELAGADATLKAAGSARLNSLKDMQFAVEAQRIDGDGEYALHLKFDPKRMDADLRLHEPAGGPLENIMALPGLGALDAQASFSGPRHAEQLTLKLKAGELVAQAAGTLNLEEASADLAVDVDSPALAPRRDLSWSRAEVHGRWHGSLKTLNAEGRVLARELKLPGEVRIKDINADVKAVRGVLNLQGRAAGLRLPGPAPDLFADGALSVEATLGLDQKSLPLSVQASHPLGSLRGQASLARPQSASGVVKVPDLVPFAALIGERIRGSATLNGDFKVVEGGGKFSLQANAALLPGKQIWARALGERAALQATATVSDAELSLDAAKLTGASLTATLAASLSRVADPKRARALRAKWSLDLADLNAVSQALAGKLRASGALQGPLSALEAEAAADASVSVRGAPSGEVSAQLKLTGLPQAPAGSLSAQGSLDASPLKLDVEMNRGQQGALRTVVRALDWKSLHADGEVNTQSGVSRGELHARMDELNDLKHLLGVNLKGGAAAELAFSPEGKRSRLSLSVDAPDVAFADLKGSLHAAAAGFSDGLPFTLELKLPQWRSAPLAVSAAGELDLDGGELTLNKAQALYRKQEIKLLTPVRLDYANGLAIDHLKVGAGAAELELQGQLAPETALRVSVRKVGPELVNTFLPDALAAGSIEAHAELHGRLQAPVGQVELNARGMRSADDAAVGLPAANLRVTANLNGHAANLDARLDAGNDSQLTVLGDAPLNADGAFDLKINGKTSVRLMNPLLEARGQHADGELEVDATVKGSAGDPDIAGTAHLKQASWRDYARGMSLTNIGAEIEGGHGEINVKTLTASAPPGTLSASGTLGVLKPKIPVDLKITAKNAQPIVSKLITANFDGELKLTGTARERVDVSGAVHLNRTLIGIPNGLPPNVAVLDVRRRGKPQKAAPAKPLVIGLDVQVDAPQEILVQGRGLDAEMYGHLHITGTTDDPMVSGEFDKQRGTFTLASSRLDITSGKVTFAGTGVQNRIDPTLDFEAETDAKTPQGEIVKITLSITGFADAPRFDLRSDKYSAGPDEILALLLFGANPQTLSGIQLAQIGAALATLSGVGGDGSINPLVKLQKSLGLDRLTVSSAPSTTGTTENSGAAIEAGRYISKRVYIEAKQSTTGFSQLQADVDLTKRLKLQTRLGNGTGTVQGTTPENDPGSSVGLIYQFEY